MKNCNFPLLHRRYDDPTTSTVSNDTSTQMSFRIPVGLLSVEDEGKLKNGIVMSNLHRQTMGDEFCSCDIVRPGSISTVTMKEMSDVARLRCQRHIGIWNLHKVPQKEHCHLLSFQGNFLSTVKLPFVIVNQQW